MAATTAHAGPSSSPTLLGTGRPLCVICGIRPHYNDGRRAFPTCGNTCARRLQAMTGNQSTSFPEDSQTGSRPMCIICKKRPQFNNGRRAFPTCGNTCARALQDMNSSHSASNSQFNTDGPLIPMCYICNVRPRYQRGGKAYPTCGLTCAARLHARDRQLTIQAGWRRHELSQTPTTPVATEDAQAEEWIEVSREDWETFKCTICLEILQVDHIARFSCQHPFCRSCLKSHITSELSEHHYPIICPLCKVEDKATNPSTVDDQMLQMLGLGDEDVSLFYELQLAAHSIVIHCQKCKESMFVDRREYEETNIIECPLPRCNYIWCKQCQVNVNPKGPRHSCDGSSELEHLMKENGWRHCPGCQTPVQKSDGCNHMTCASPGCNMHFCYRCGANIIKSLRSANIREATQAHYRSCQLF